MAYLRSARRACGESGCTSGGNFELMDRRNGSRGYFCKKHAERRLSELRAREEAEAT